MNKAKTISRPWKLWPYRERTDPIICVGDTPAEFRSIATVSGETKQQADAHADLIFRAVNAHDALLAACEAFERMFALIPGDTQFSVQDALAFCEARQAATAALALARTGAAT